jgi:hypothetical protein
MSPVLKNKIVGIFGSRGSGKTYLAAKMYGMESRALVYNTASDSQFTARSTFVLSGDARSIHQELPLIMRPKPHLFQRKPPEPNYWRISFLPVDLDADDDIPSFQEACRQCWITGNMTLYVDELHMHTTSAYAPSEFRKLVYMGRHRQVSVIYMAHRVYDIPKKLTANTEIFYFFQTSEPRDLDTIEERVNVEAAEQVEKLKRLNLRVEPIDPPQVYVWDAYENTGKVVDL